MHHVSLTIVDLNRSKEWYSRVLGWTQVAEGGDYDHYVSVGALPDGTLIGLWRHRGSDVQFDVTRPGLDHLAIGVGSVEELALWEQRFDEQHVTYSPPQEAAPWGWALSFKDPEGIASEIFARPSHAAGGNCLTRGRCSGHHGLLRAQLAEILNQRPRGLNGHRSAPSVIGSFSTRGDNLASVGCVANVQLGLGRAAPRSQPRQEQDWLVWWSSQSLRRGFCYRGRKRRTGRASLTRRPARRGLAA